MANKKDLKKAVKNICGELFADCVALSMTELADKEKLQGLMAEVANTYGDFVARINHVEPGLSPRKFFQKLRADFTEKANQLSDEIIKA
ncbi:MAG: hypothetical protein IJ722_02210 [Alloprevotella sp.]|nr:hypothetical protein [Alloprevotella sp.]